MIRKAAVLVASLDRESADAMLARMPPEHAQRVRAEILEMGPIDPEEQSEVIEEFFRIGPLVPEKNPAGIDLTTSAAREVSRRAADTLGAGMPFECLSQAPAAALAALLEREHPQTVALIVSHLPADRAAAALVELPGALQAEVARRLVDLDETDPEVISDIERVLASRLAGQGHWPPRRSQGMATLHTILSAADRSTQQGILANLAAHNQQLARKVATPASSALTFSDLDEISDEGLSRLLRSVDAQVLVLALAGAGRTFVDRALQVLPPDDAKVLEDAMANLGPTRLSDVEEAQRELAAVARQLHRQGQLDLGWKRHLSLAV